MVTSTPWTKPILMAVLVGIWSGLAVAQTPLNREEKLAQKVRVAYLEATAHISVPVITPDSVLAHLQDSTLLLIDVRSDPEIAVSRLPGALSPGEFSGTYRYTGLPKDKILVTYCTIGYRSGKFAEQLAAKGAQVRNLEGGILAWVGKKGPLVHREIDGRNTPTTRLHVYAKEWNLVPPGYQATWD